MQTIRNLVLLSLVIGLAACGDDTPSSATAQPDSTTPAQTAPQIAAPAKPSGIFLRYDVFEPGVEPYQTRIVITDDFMRIDDDDNPRNFVLVDRKQEIVYSVSDENEAVLIVPREPVTLEKPFPITNTEQRIVEQDMPSIDGKPTARYIFEANKQACYDAVVAEGLLPKAAAALAQYLAILAGEHASTLKTIPADMVTPCDVDMHIFNPGMHLVHGLPIREVDPSSGYRRQLVEFEDDYEVDPALFVLPEGFGRFSINDMKGGQDDAPVAVQPGG